MIITATKEETEARGKRCAKELWDYNFSGVNPALALMMTLAPEIYKLDGFTDAFKKEWNRLWMQNGNSENV